MADIDSSYRRLGGGVLMLAVNDLRSKVALKRAAARQWLLHSPDAEFWCTVADVNLTAIRKGIEQGSHDQASRRHRVRVHLAHLRRNDAAREAPTESPAC